MEHYELLVIGGGPGGYEAALHAARLGLRTALAENRDLGGTCLNRGCIPTKSLLHAAELAVSLEKGGEWGIAAESLSVDFAALHRKKSEVTEKLRAGVEGLLKQKKVDVLRGTGTILAPGRVAVDGVEYGADHILIATGSVPARPPIPGLERAITSDEALSDQARAYRSLVIIGGGVIGVELACVYQALGCRVTIVEAMDRILPNMDREICQNMTMILKRQPLVPDATTAGLDTVGVRCPNHPVTLAIIREAGVPIAAPSANTSGRPSCTTAQDVMEDVGDAIEGVVDGGPCVVGVESTVLDLTCDPPRLLRPGGLPVEDMERLIGHIDVDKSIHGAKVDRPGAPGMKYRHYAPKAPVTVITGAPEASAREIERWLGPTSGVICFDEYAHLYQSHPVEQLGAAQDRWEQARRLFNALRAMDEAGVKHIWAQCPDTEGMGLAVVNRLDKAAGFRIVEV